MIICLDGLLSGKDLGALLAKVELARFRDGKATAGWSAKLVKNNLQLDASDRHYPDIAARIDAALRANEVFMLATLPRVLQPPIISRSEPGMFYGSHVDDALMGDPPARTDLSYTLFLSPPENYEGGELVVESASGEQEYKLPAGAAVVYPSTYLHRVNAVRSGTRQVAVGWVQSLVRDAAQRELLFDLNRTRLSVFAKIGKGEEFDLLSRACSNLLRSWSEL